MSRSHSFPGSDEGGTNVAGFNRAASGALRNMGLRPANGSGALESTMRPLKVFPLLALFTRLMPLSCPHCDNDLSLTVDHHFDCPNLTSLRNSHNIPHSRSEHLLTIHPFLLTYFHTYMHRFLFTHLAPFPSSELIALTI